MNSDDPQSPDTMSRIGSSGRDHRQFERFNLNLNRSVNLRGKAKRFPILNVSYGGICFLSSDSYTEGDELDIIYESVRITVRVMDCQIVETDPDLMTFYYKIRGNFHRDEPAMAKLIVDMIVTM